MSLRNNFLFRNIKPNLNMTILAAFFKTVESVVDLTLPFMMAMVIDNGVMSRDFNYVINKGIFMGIIILIGYISSVICTYFSVFSAQRVGASMRDEVFSKIQNLTFTQLNKFSQASLITRATKDIDNIILMYMMSSRVMFRIIVTILGAMVISFSINKGLSLIFFLFLPIGVSIIYVYMKKSIPIFCTVQEKLDKLSKTLHENLVGVRVIKALSKEKIEEEKFENSNMEFRESAIKGENVMVTKIPFVTLIMNIGIVIILWLGGYKANNGEIKIGEIVALINYFSMVIFLLTPLSFIFTLTSKCIVSYGRLKEIFDEKIREEFGNEKINENSENLIEFKNVFFSYNGKPPYVLENINLTVKKGETLSIIGGVGAGKSTLISLIPRFYDPTLGEILIGGIDIKKINLLELRKKIGVVLQKSFLFTGTVKENISWGREVTSSDDIFMALEIAKADSFIGDLPRKESSCVLKGGMNFSGGQKQRIAIARTVIKNSEILILDDSFSALDAITEAELKSNITNKIGEITKIIISQRVSQVKKSDKIIVMDNGRIVGTGKHEELMEKCGIYREICISQDIPLLEGRKNEN